MQVYGGARRGFLSSYCQEVPKDCPASTVLNRFRFQVPPPAKHAPAAPTPSSTVLAELFGDPLSIVASAASPRKQEEKKKPKKPHAEHHHKVSKAAVKPIMNLAVGPAEAAKIKAAAGSSPPPPRPPSVAKVPTASPRASEPKKVKKHKKLTADQAADRVETKKTVSTGVTGAAPVANKSVLGSGSGAGVDVSIPKPDKVKLKHPSGQKSPGSAPVSKSATGATPGRLSERVTTPKPAKTPPPPPSGHVANGPGPVVQHDAGAVVKDKVLSEKMAEKTGKDGEKLKEPAKKKKKKEKLKKSDDPKSHRKPLSKSGKVKDKEAKRSKSKDPSDADPASKKPKTSHPMPTTEVSAPVPGTQPPAANGAPPPPPPQEPPQKPPEPCTEPLSNGTSGSHDEMSAERWESLIGIQSQIVKLADRSVAQSLVDLLQEESVDFSIGEETLDFDLCLLSDDTLEKVKRVLKM